MTGAIESIVGQLSHLGAGIRERGKVSLAEYREFERHWVFYALQEKRYGQAFCEHFGFGNGLPLYAFKDEKISRRWINDNYLEQ